MPKHDPAPIEGVKPFTDSLRMLEGGHLIEDCSDALRELNARLADHTATHGSAKGKLILTISLHHKGGIVIAEADVTTKAPKISRRWSR